MKSTLASSCSTCCAIRWRADEESAAPVAGPGYRGDRPGRDLPALPAGPSAPGWFRARPGDAARAGPGHRAGGYRREEPRRDGEGSGTLALATRRAPRANRGPPRAATAP